MKETQKKFIHDAIAEILNLPKNKVIWAYQNNMPRQVPPFILLRLWGMDAEAQEEIRPIINSDLKNIFVSQSVILEVQYFAGTNCNIDPSHELQKLVRELETPPWADAFFAEKVVIYDAELVQDLTDLLNGQTYEYRASVDLHVRYNSEVESDMGQIETVNIRGTDIPGSLPGGGSDTTPGGGSISGGAGGSGNSGGQSVIDGVFGNGALIYGNIDSAGNVSDWMRALPVDLNINR